MAKALKTAALVVGAVALIATGVGAAGAAGLLGAGIAGGASIAGIATAATLTTIGTIAGAAAAIVSLGISALAKAPGGSLAGTPTKFTIDKDSGIPVVFGRTYVGGRVLHRQYYGAKNAYESWVTALSLGPVHSIGPLLINKVEVAFSGGAALGTYAGYMWLDDQLGACPETSALVGPQGPFPGWGATSKLSGLAADLWTMKFDTKGKVYPNGVPERGRVLEGLFVYDMRQDSTFPGGSGACRLGDEATYVYSTSPALHAVTWAYGRHQNGVLVAGGGLDLQGIDLNPFCDWANVCDLNAWSVGGIVYTTDDNTWDVLKMIAQAGGGEVLPVGALLSCTFSAPRVSIGTITSADICGEVDTPSSAPRRTRRNTVIPRVRLESHGWEMIPLDAIAVPTYVTVDGGSRPTEIAFPLVQSVDQGAQLGLYALLDGRELDGIILPCKVYAIGYRPGDCLTLNIPESDLTGRTVIVRNREIDGSTMGVTLTCRSEDPTKHSFALGHGGSAPRTPDLSIPTNYPPETRGAYDVVLTTPTYPFTSDDDSLSTAGCHAVLEDAREYDFPAGTISGLASGTRYVPFWNFAGSYYFAEPYPALTGMADPANVFFETWSTSSSGSYPTADTPTPGYGGGYCPADDTMILLANEARDGPGIEIAMRDLVVGRDWAWTRHEHSGEWGAYPLAALRFADDAPVFRAAAEMMPQALAGVPVRPLRATADHPIGGAPWTMLGQIGAPDGAARIAIVEVTDAHTYVANGVLSHNKRATSPEG